MIKRMSNLLTRLRRFSTVGSGRFAGGSAISGPSGLLAVQQERLLPRRQPKGGEVPCTMGNTCEQAAEAGSTR